MISGLMKSSETTERSSGDEFVHEDRPAPRSDRTEQAADTKPEGAVVVQLAAGRVPSGARVVPARRNTVGRIRDSEWVCRLVSPYSR
jgi:hypothetical protein